MVKVFVPLDAFAGSGEAHMANCPHCLLAFLAQTREVLAIAIYFHHTEAHPECGSDILQAMEQAEIEDVELTVRNGMVEVEVT